MEKKYLATLFVLLALIAVGCRQSNNPIEEKHENPTEEKVKVYYEDYKENEAHLWVNITIYQDEEYEYVLGPHKKAYVEYKGKQYSYSKALSENILTIDELINAGAKIYKKEINNN